MLHIWGGGTWSRHNLCIQRGNVPFFERETRKLPFFVLFYSSEVLYTWIFWFFFRLFLSWLMKYFCPGFVHLLVKDSSLTSKQNRINNDAMKRYQVMRSVNKSEMKEEEDKIDDKPEEENIETLRRSPSRPPESIKRNVSLHKGHSGKRCGSKNWLNQIREMIKKRRKGGCRSGGINAFWDWYRTKYKKGAGSNKFSFIWGGEKNLISF